ncbi:M4 family metallopeptidase, partial [Nocardioides sp.]|uniref:M4 family metallopeptidase n=1 Tax=Nocardioides sp. TaxID=35761 RepID=UPI002727E052
MRPVPCFLPPHLLRRLAQTDPAAAATLATDERIRAARATFVPAAVVPARAVAEPAWTVHDADNTQDLPGRPVRSAGDPATGDEAVDEAADGVAASLALLSEAFGRDSYDDAGARVLATVHFGVDYVNAFWDGGQLVFGDGDGVLFDRFTKPVDVIGHELAHAVTERTAALAYQGQSGALNESVSDVFAACLVQRLRDQTAADADWLIGAGLFLPGVEARALRDMRAPGTAYDDPRLGQDPQVGHLDDYVETTDDNGGVHLNSGIPNHAFQLAATAIGGRSWEGAGPVWFAALTGGGVRPDTDFAGFAAATVAAAG